MAQARADAKKAAVEPVSNALAFQELRNGVKIQTNISFVGAPKAVKSEMLRVLNEHPDAS